MNLKPDTKSVIPQAFNRLVKLGESEKSVCKTHGTDLGPGAKIQDQIRDKKSYRIDLGTGAKLQDQIRDKNS